jgi:hypothetical protein
VLPSEPNNSGQGKDATIPAEVAYMGWNWGAFFLNWIWGLRNHTRIALLTLIPGPCFVMPFVLGSRGSEWAWQNQRWRDVEHFKLVQRAWAWAGLVVFVAGIIGGSIGWRSWQSRQGVSFGPTVGASIPTGYVIRRSEDERFAVAVPSGWQSEETGYSRVRLSVGGPSIRPNVAAALVVLSDDGHTVFNLDALADNPIVGGEEIQGEVLERHRVHLAAGEAEVISLLSSSTFDPWRFHTVYLLVHEHQGYALELGSNESGADLDAFYDAIAASLAFLR